MYELNKDELKTIKEISSKYYMCSVLQKLDNFINVSKSKKTYLEAFNEIYNSIINSKEENDVLLETKRQNGEIKSIEQARKSIAGSVFSNSIIYIFLKNKEIENIRGDIFITSKRKTVPDFDNISTIKVGNETQKPDCDLIIYTLNQENKLNKCIILSLKTSLRERAGQTYKWKLLMEIANSDNSIKDKYDIVYNPTVNPLVCFATINFYNEINNPQQRGMFKFFDSSFIAKNLENKGAFINYMSELAAFVNREL